MPNAEKTGTIIERKDRKFDFYYILEATLNKLERDFQTDLVREIKRRFTNSFVLRIDPSKVPGTPTGFPDILVLWNNHWFALECKRTSNSRKRPLQDHYISKLNEMSYAAFIFPENKEEVLNAIQQTFQP